VHAVRCVGNTHAGDRLSDWLIAGCASTKLVHSPPGRLLASFVLWMAVWEGAPHEANLVEVILLYCNATIHPCSGSICECPGFQWKVCLEACGACDTWARDPHQQWWASQL
jgi:hypothetical protein